MESSYLAMNEKRFCFLIRCLCVVNLYERVVRKNLDKLTPIRDIFSLIVQNFQKYYAPSEYQTTDEQLLTFRGNFLFRQYIPSKSVKYEIKTFALVDYKTAFILN